MNFFKFLFSKAFWIQIVLAVVVSIVLVFLALKWLDYDTHHGETIKVPDLSKMQLEEVDQELAKLHLTQAVLDSTNYNPDFPKYSVIEQTPKPGKAVKKGRKIYLELNPSGYPMIEIPNLFRHTKREAVAMLTSLGFEIGEMTYKPDIARDAVLELWANGKEIKPGDKIMKTTTVNFVLGSGNPEDSVKENSADSLKVDQEELQEKSEE